MTTYHIYPQDDSSSHKVRGMNCKCQPDVRHTKDGATYVIHKAFEGNELIEEAKKILNSKIA